MCRNIKILFHFDPPVTDAEVRAAALQYVRKISGFTQPSQTNAAAFERAVEDVAEVSARLLSELVTSAPAKDREAEADKLVLELPENDGLFGGEAVQRRLEALGRSLNLTPRTAPNRVPARVLI